jgi:peptidoglycan/LPS O-acetylase OafA/YrhL
LRAIAVLIVVFFHAFPDTLSGGFVGVDVFFVISGYLITGLILRDLRDGRFSLRHFYVRRIRRIFPALSLVLGFGLLAGWLCLNFIEYKQLAKHTGSSAIFLTNFMLLRESGYFDNAADTKPMLHLWSLAIEEQFYMAWPLLLLLFKRIPRWSLPILVSLMLFSVGYSLWLVFKGELARDFYSPLSRSWELLLGASLAIALMNNPRLARAWRNPAGWWGLALILLSAYFFDKDMAFPGYWAALPALGAALVLLAGMNSSVNSLWLASRPLVAIGLISYPLYLWHWPLLSFARILASQTPSIEVRLGLVGLSFVLAYLTYRWVEQPIRFSQRYPRAVMWLCLWMVAVLLMSHGINRFDGLKFRHHGMLNADPSTLIVGTERGTLNNSCTLPPDKQELLMWCFQDGKLALPNHVVLGDSKGEALIYSLIRSSPPEDSWAMMGPINLLSGEDNPLNKAAYAAIDNNPDMKVVVLSNALRGMFRLDPLTGLIAQHSTSEEIDAHVATYSRMIRHWQANGRHVVFVIDNPTLPDPNSCISGGLTRFELLNTVLQRQQNPQCLLRFTDHLKGTAAYQEFITKLKHDNPDLLVYDPLPLLCDIPADTCTIAKEGKFLYSYGDHISDHAGMLMAKDMLPLINAMNK